MNNKTPNSKKFLSLKWKALLPSSLVLVIITILFSAISYIDLKKQARYAQEAEHHHYTQAINGLILQSRRHLEQLGEIIPSMSDMRDALLSGNSNNIRSVFDQHWPRMQIQLGLDVANFYTNSGQPLAGWQTPGFGPSKINEAMIQRVAKQEYPISDFDCNVRCIQYTLIPILIEGHSRGVMLLGMSLADTVTSFKSMSGADVGVLTKQNMQENTADTDKVITTWGMRVIALTNSAHNMELLNNTSRKYQNLSMLERGVEIALDNHHYKVRLLPVSGNTSDKLHLITIADISSGVRLIQDSLWQNVSIGILGLLISEALLFFILSTPLSRLSHTAHTLPLLAKNAFEAVRQAIRRHKGSAWFRDEIDILNSTSIALSHQLEELEKQVSDRSKTLATRMGELAQEKDFIASLLDTAQVIILTENSHGEILTINNHGEHLTCYTQQELQGKAFTQFASSASVALEVDKGLVELFNGQKDNLSHEAITVRKDGGELHIVWLHSRLSGRTEHGPMILSVGLDITERKQAEHRLSWLANHDPLTGLLNRRRFQEELEQILLAAQRYDRSGALLFFDLDQFKYINDTSGHQAGDSLLKLVADMFPHVIRATDVVGRLGGDEFGIILPETTAAGAIEVAKKIINYLRATDITIHARTHKVSASIGIALFLDHGKDVHDLLAIADLAMYQAKEVGRGGWHLFSNSDHSRERMQELVYWKEKIEKALAEDRFVLYYQPIKGISSNDITHYEVLLRMLDETGALISPNTFIPAAERCGLIHAIDHMVLRKAIDRGVKLNQLAMDITLSINLSGRSFEDPQLLPILKATLAEQDVDPTKFIFEITETAAVADLSATSKLMTSIKALGCNFALDDFGVGFSSFYYIKQLPIDYVKIDGSFIRNLADHSDDQILVKALCDVANGFGKKIVAECVENVETLTLLAQYQVDFVQGYYIGKPMPEDQAFGGRIISNSI